MKHGDPDLYILMNSPRFDFIMEIDTDYDPTRASDQGGIVAFRDNQSRIEMLEYYDPEKGTAMKYNNLRMKRTGDLFEGYGSNDGGKTWELIGVSYLAAPKVGMVLHGIQESSSDTMDVLEMRMYRSTVLQVGNLNEGMTVKLVNTAGTVLAQAVCKAESDHADIEIGNMTLPLKGRVQLFDSTGFKLAETEALTDIWGGDIFWYGIQLDIEIDGINMRQDREFQLGNMQAGIIEKKLYVVNNTDIPIYNLRASIQAFTEYKGWEWADLSLDVFNQPGAYQDNLYLGHIQPGERVPVWMKVTRQPHQQLASLNDYKFRIMIESG